MTNSEIMPDHKEAGEWKKNNRNAGMWTGIFLLIIGGVALAKSYLAPIPDWLFNWRTLLIAIGIFVGIRSNFRGAGWFIMILTGGAFLLNDFYFTGDLRAHIWPLFVIAIGAIFLLRPRSSGNYRKRGRETSEDMHMPYSHENFADITILFGSARKNLGTQNFAGGDITAIFGGAELDLTNANFQGTAVIDVTAIFGGAELIIPSDWTVKSDIVSVFGSVKDKRVKSPAVGEDPRKILILDGTAMFGGIEIRSFKK